MVVQQVDLVDVEDAPVRRGQQTGLVADLARTQGLLQVQRTDHAVLGSAHGQLDEPGRSRDGTEVGVRPVRAERVRVVRVAAEPAAGHHGDRR